MERLRAWTLSFCFACVVAGLLGQFSSERKRFSVIKLVLALYILTAALSPLQGEAGMRLPEPAAPAPAMAAPDTGALVMGTAEEQLAKAVGQALTQAGVAHGDVAVRLSQEGEAFEVEWVRVTAPPGQTQSAVRQAVSRALGADVPVVLREEGS